MMMLLQAAPPPATPPDTNMNTSLVLTKAAGQVAIKIDQAISPQMLSGRQLTTTYKEPDYGSTKGWYQFADYMNVLFFSLIAVAVVTFLWDFVNLLIDAGTSENSEDRLHRLIDSEILKKGFKLAILLVFGVATWAYQYRPGMGTFKIGNTAIMDGASVKDTAEPLLNLMNPINLIVAPTTGAPAVDSSISGTIAKASNKLGAWHFARQAIEQTAKWQATQAAQTYWTSMHPNGDTPAGGPPTTDPNSANAGSTGALQLDAGGIGRFFAMIGNALMSYGMSAVLLFMNFGLDVMIVRTLMFNAIYLLIAYKVAILILPLAIIAAYWHQWEGILRGAIQIMIVTVISLNVLCDMTAIIVSPEQVQAVITDATTQTLAPDKQAEMAKYAKMIYARMTSGGQTITWEQYKSAVVNDMGSDSSSYVFNLDATFWAPIRVFLLLTIMVTLIGKIGSVVSDTIAGTMTYHRS